MAEQREATGTCWMGSATESPCTYPATEPIRGLTDGAPALCAYHAATQPLMDEYDHLNLALELLRSYQKGARRHDNTPLIFALEQLEADFRRRLEVVGRVADDLREADTRLFRR